MISDELGADRLLNRPYTRQSRCIGQLEGGMNWHSRLIALFVILALTGCTPMAAKPGQVPNAPNQQGDPRDTSGMH
jgi:hypothetical protein